MIDFRYHLVSIVAVFLALAIGIVVGATQLKPATSSILDSQSNAEKHTINSLRTTNKSLQGQVGLSQEFAQAAAPRLLPGLLTGQRAVIVTAPGADGPTVAGISSALQEAGARVTGEVGLQGRFLSFGAGNESTLSTLAQELAPAGVTPAGSLPSQLASDTKISGQVQAGQVLATALIAPQNSSTTADPGSQNSGDLPAAQVSAILTGFASQGYISVSPAGGAAALEQATLAVVVIPAAPPQDGDSDPANLALISLADQLRAASRGTIMAGPLPGSGAGSAIDELINGNTGVQLSTVDDADSELGQVMVAQALASLVAGHQPAAYGVGPGAVPSPDPTQPAPSPSKSSAKPKSTG